MFGSLLGLDISTNDDSVADKYKECLDKLCDQNEEWQIAGTALMALIGIYGVIRQQQALEDQIDLQERLVEQGQDYLDLATRNYEEIALRTFREITLPAFENITVPAFECQKSLFDRYDAQMRQFEIDALACTIDRPKDYDPAYEAAQGRAMSTVSGTFDRAQRSNARRRNRYSTGRCCAENVWFAIEKAKAQSRAANEGYRYEDTLKRDLDQWFFQRRIIGGEFAAQARANVISGVNGGVAGVNSGLASINAGVNSTSNALNGIGQALGRTQEATQGLSQALGNQASFFGNISNGAFQAIGFQSGYSNSGSLSGSQGLFNGFGGFGGQNAGSAGGGFLNQQNGGGYFYNSPGTGGSFTGGSTGGIVSAGQGVY